jgi:hypothetical protein
MRLVLQISFDPATHRSMKGGESTPARTNQPKIQLQHHQGGAI